MTCTEMRVNDVLFRCHPNCRGEGPFYDWAILQSTPCRARPCKIVAFLPDVNDLDVANQTLEETLVVVQPCGKKNTITFYSV